MGQFLSLVGLAALVIAGIGVGNGVASYLAGKRPGLATLKILGADSAAVMRIYGLQILTVAAVAIAAGLVVGALAPTLITMVAGDALPVKPGLAVRSEEHTSELQSLMRISYAVFCLKKKK